MADHRPMEPRQESEFKENVITIDRVARVVKGGRRFRFRALVVVGNGKKKIGIGVSKGSDVQLAISKAVDVAKKNMKEVAISKGTIPHQIQSKHSGAEVLLMPARPGTGLIAGGTVRAVLEVTGIDNVLSKSLGSNNKLNVAYATLKALTELEPRENWVTTIDTPQKSAPKTTKKAEEKPATKKKAESKKGTPNKSATKKNTPKEKK